MDENKLADLFRDAANDAPPAAFDVADVRTASRRATQRRRNAIAGGTALVVVLGFGGVVAGTNWVNQDKGTESVAGAGQPEDNSAQSPLSAPVDPPNVQTKNFPGDLSTQGDTSPPGSADPSVGGRAVQGCAVVDRELAVALAGELSVPPDLAAAPAVSCSPPSRSAAFKIDGLTITAVVTADEFLPPGGADTAKVRTARGEDLYVFTQGDGELKGQARRVADAIAPRF
ncbi:hypothetical protein [Nocardia sp. NRRL S-836]|uniref:hypothetical protein n=1 Tax=Nocardia sp. NRRL S-836 TaxID=1519492 RepID=UPI0006ADD7F3|nr:hypothetical protein [Nocardia sp. NRRL S-836]KOV75521.1 hypothetical protein ADL03_44635 [Nocardia sp. NRRL S-836]